MSQIIIIFLILIYKVLSERCDPCECQISGTYLRKITCGQMEKYYVLLQTIPAIQYHEKIDWLTLGIKNQNVTVLKKNAFVNVNLTTLNYLEIQYSKLEIIEEGAFENVTDLYDLYLNDNNIVKLSNNIFNATKYIKTLDLSNNKIINIEDKLFSELTQLTFLKLNNNRIKTIGANALKNNNMLQDIAINDNLLNYLNASSLFFKYQSLKLSISGNPWTCDCLLRDLFNYIRKTENHKEETKNTNCKAPVFDDPWKDIKQDEFNCWLVVKSKETNMESRIGKTVRLSCLVNSSPMPTGMWTFDNKKIHTPSKKYNISTEVLNQVSYMYHLDIFDLNYDDEGEYKCLLSNPNAQDQEEGINLKLSGREIDSAFIFIIAGLGACIICVIIIILKCVVKCHVLRTTGHDRSNFRDTPAFEDDVSITGIKIDTTKNVKMNTLSRITTNMSSNRT